MPKLSFVVPCYQNEDSIPYTTVKLIENEITLPEDVDFEYVMVDDGSNDETLTLLKEFKAAYPDRVKVIKLTGNFGSYNALYAGLSHVTGDCCVVVSADLQDPLELVERMYAYWKSGLKVVLANRVGRNDGHLNNFFSRWYHKVIKLIALPNLPEGGFDFCMFDRQVIDQILQTMESNTNSLFLALLFKYEHITIPYERSARVKGRSMWTIGKRIDLLIDSVFSFSRIPARMISTFGALLFLVAMGYGSATLVQYVSGNLECSHWSFIIAVLLMLAALQMMALGILAEYLWRTLESSRKRPPYVIDEVY